MPVEAPEHFPDSGTWWTQMGGPPVENWRNICCWVQWSYTRWDAGNRCLSKQRLLSLAGWMIWAGSLQWVAWNHTSVSYMLALMHVMLSEASQKFWTAAWVYCKRLSGFLQKNLLFHGPVEWKCLHPKGKPWLVSAPLDFRERTDQYLDGCEINTASSRVIICSGFPGFGL